MAYLAACLLGRLPARLPCCLLRFFNHHARLWHCWNSGPFHFFDLVVHTLVAAAAEYETGSIYRPGVPASINGRIGGSSGKDSNAWAANPTLLEPRTRRRQLHYASSPFLSFMPLDPARHAGIAARSKPRALTEVSGLGSRQADRLLSY